jgi:transcriptional regulator with XRE-family HTH domain
MSNIKEEILLQFGEKVREFRKAKRLSEEKLAFRSNLQRSYIGMIERGEKNITLINIEKIAKGLEINVY